MPDREQPQDRSGIGQTGIYVDGNIHGNEIQAGEVALYLLDYLLGAYGQNEEITRLVDSRCFYVVPVVNADGRYHFFADANTPSDNRSLRIPRDDDRDGLVDEDFPDDLDKDGNICEMRKRDPFGEYKTDPDDPRLLVRIKPGEKGEWTILGDEGLDNDDDGAINEDPEGYLDGNRNWGYDWMPEYVQAGAGDYPFSGAITKALAGFIEQTSQHLRGLVFPQQRRHVPARPQHQGPGRIPQAGYRGLRLPRPAGRADHPRLPLHDQLEGPLPDLRRFAGMADHAAGRLRLLSASCFRPKPSALPASRKTPGRKKSSRKRTMRKAAMISTRTPALEKQRIKFNDHLTQGELYKPWHEFNHPVYGKIEIGGWVKMSSRLPAPFMLKDLVHRNASAVIFSAKNTPEISLEVFETKSMGNGLTRIRTRLANARAIPSMSYQARKSKLYPQDMLLLNGSGIKVVAGGEINDSYLDQVTYKEFRPEMQFLIVPGFGKVEHEFLVSGSGSLTSPTSRATPERSARPST